MIEFKNVTKSFGERTILDNLSFKIHEGKVTFVIGKSGEGKSVAIKHIIGLLQPNDGEVIVDEQKLSDLSEEELLEHRKQIGMLFQHAALFDSFSVFDNIAFPLVEHSNLSSSEISEKVHDLAKELELENVLHKMPSDLSVGEKKRVGLGRALINDPKILLYDEPTTGMDPLIAEMIDQLILHVNQNKPKLTSIVISHDLKAAMSTADKIIMLYKGKVLLEGSPDEFKQSKDPVIRQFFSGQPDGPMQLT